MGDNAVKSSSNDANVGGPGLQTSNGYRRSGTGTEERTHGDRDRLRIERPVMRTASREEALG